MPVGVDDCFIFGTAVATGVGETVLEVTAVVTAVIVAFEIAGQVNKELEKLENLEIQKKAILNQAQRKQIQNRIDELYRRQEVTSSQLRRQLNAMSKTNSTRSLTNLNQTLKYPNFDQLHGMHQVKIKIAGHYDSYVVEQNDSLGNIATQFGTTSDTLFQLNKDTLQSKNPERVYSGESLIVPRQTPPNNISTTYNSLETKSVQKEQGRLKIDKNLLILPQDDYLKSNIIKIQNVEKFLLRVESRNAKKGSIPSPSTNQSLKDWLNKSVSANNDREWNKQSAELINEAEQLGIVDINSETKDTFDKIINGEKIGNGKKNNADSQDNYFDPKTKKICILQVIAAILKSSAQKYGDGIQNHKFSLGSFMTWNDNDPSKNRYKGELRTSNHGPGKAIDINGIGSKHDFKSHQALMMVMEILNELPSGRYGIGLPEQGEFIDSSGKIKAPELAKFFKEHSKDFYFFKDANNHVHIQTDRSCE